MILKTHKVLMMLVASLMISSCNKVEDEAYTIDATDEMAQQIGDVMVSIDESGGTTNGSISKLNGVGYEKSFARLSRGQGILSNLAAQDIADLFISKSYAADCSAVAFGACSGGMLIRDFASCSLPDRRPTVDKVGMVNGSIRLMYSGTGVGTCRIPTNADYVVRVPNYRITGLRGVAFEVTVASGEGQRLTRIGAASYTFSSTAIRRKFSTASGKDVLDLTVATNSAIGITNNARNGRSATGGVLNITDNMTQAYCNVSPNSVSWSTGCNCPTSGTWSGTCSDSQTLTVAFSGTCGETTLTKGSTIKAVTLDRCQP